MAGSAWQRRKTSRSSRPDTTADICNSSRRGTPGRLNWTNGKLSSVPNGAHTRQVPLRALPQRDLQGLLSSQLPTHRARGLHCNQQPAHSTPGWVPINRSCPPLLGTQGTTRRDQLSHLPSRRLQIHQVPGRLAHSHQVARIARQMSPTRTTSADGRAEDKVLPRHLHHPRTQPPRPRRQDQCNHISTWGIWYMSAKCSNGT